MQKVSFIKSFSTILIMGILVFSITPKKFLHDLIADHTDTLSLPVHDGHDHIDHHGFKCDCDNLVATSPFLYEGIVVAFNSVADLSTFLSVNFPIEATKDIIAETLRGPPAMA